MLKLSQLVPIVNLMVPDVFKIPHEGVMEIFLKYRCFLMVLQ
jgi:hypothetical protein